MQRVRMHMHERVLLCSTTRRTRKIANAEANNPNLMMLENANFSSSSCYLLRITRDTTFDYLAGSVARSAGGKLLSSVSIPIEER